MLFKMIKFINIKFQLNPTEFQILEIFNLKKARKCIKNLQKNRNV